VGSNKKYADQSDDLLVYIKDLLDSNKLNEAEIRLILQQALEEKSLAPFPEIIFLKYKSLIEGTKINCPKSWRKNLNISIVSLKEACYEIVDDLHIILTRRKGLIGKDKETGLPRISRSKIAGITTFRLAKAHIIHMNPDCVSCNDDRIKKGQFPCPVSNFNTEFAIICGLHFIKKDYLTIPKEIRTELIYNLTKRHMNQETLGIVFDTLRHIQIASG